MARDFATTDRQAAINMAAAAEAAGLERLIYLGGLLPEDQTLSKHLASRAEVARVLASGALTGRAEPRAPACLIGSR